MHIVLTVAKVLAVNFYFAPNTSLPSFPRPANTYATINIRRIRNH